MGKTCHFVDYYNLNSFKIEFLGECLQLKLEIMISNCSIANKSQLSVGLFSDGSSFMELADGRVAYCTEQKTWKQVFLHGLPLNDCLYYQSHRPNISFYFKHVPSRPKREKEGLNDEDRCEYCNLPFDSITFRSKKDGSKYALCSECVRTIYKMRDSDPKVYKQHLGDIDALLYRLSGVGPIVSISWIYPYLINFINHWERSNMTNLSVIVRIKCILDSWYHEYGDVNVSYLINDLQTLQGILSDEVDTLISLQRKRDIWW